jgi:hypothetical protein
LQFPSGTEFFDPKNYFWKASSEFLHFSLLKTMYIFKHKHLFHHRL